MSTASLPSPTPLYPHPVPPPFIPITHTISILTLISIPTAGSSLIIYLYLVDSDNVNSIVLATYTVTMVLEFWKVARVLAIRAKLKASQRDGGTGSGVGVAAATERFDELATRTLTIGLVPLIAGWALYALTMYPHKSWCA